MGLFSSNSFNNFEFAAAGGITIQAFGGGGIECTETQIFSLTYFVWVTVASNDVTLCLSMTESYEIKKIRQAIIKKNFQDYLPDPPL